MIFIGLIIGLITAAIIGADGATTLFILAIFALAFSVKGGYHPRKQDDRRDLNNSGSHYRRARRGK